MKQKIIGVMGPGQQATEHECFVAYEMGKLIADSGYALLTGGVAHGVMENASKGAKKQGGLTFGILPYKKDSETHPVSEYVDYAFFTNFGEARNVINVMSCNVVVIIGMCPGTATEACHAIKNNIPIILLHTDHNTRLFLTETLEGNVTEVNSVEMAMELIEQKLKKYPH